MFKSRLIKQNVNKETDEKQFSKLSPLFIKNPKKAIEKASKYFIKSKKKVSYEQFINEIKSTQHTSFCSISWTKVMLCAQCLDCQKLENACFCIPCFLSGHHEHHNSFLFSCYSGCCDCGNLSFINPSGFCSNHPGPDSDPDITQMTPENRTKFITVFQAAYYGAINSTSEDNMIECIKYISQFIPYGDGLRRCASYAIVFLSKEHLYKNIIKMTVKMIQALIDLFGQLVSDFYFQSKMSFLYYQNFPYLSQTIGKFLIEHDYNSVYQSMKLFDSISFHYFSINSVTYSIQKKDFNWPDFLVNLIEVSLDILVKSGFEYEENYEANTIHRIQNVSSYLWSVSTLDNQLLKIQEFINKYSNLLVKYEGMLSFYARSTPEDVNNKGYNVESLMEVLGKMNSFFFLDTKNKPPQNKQFSITNVVSNLFKFCKEKKISADSVFDSIKKTNVSTVLPLHNLLFCLLQNYDDIKSVIEYECKNNNIDFQQFCSLVSICPLRVLAFFFCSGKFFNLNKSNLNNLEYLKLFPLISFNCYFGLVQILLSISPNKEEIFGNIFSIFGCYDEISEFKNKLNETDFKHQVFLSNNVDLDAGIFIMSLLTDHSVLSLNKTYFNTLRVIELLKKSHSTSTEIQLYIYEKIIDHNFSDILLEHIERIPSKKGSNYFKLKNEGDFTPFFPLINVNDRMNLLANYGEKLIPVLDYEELPKGISLKDCFRSPSFVALTFKLLSSDIMTQVGIAMFICLVKNGEIFSPQSFKVASSISVRAEDLKSLISELSKTQYVLNKDNVLTFNIQYKDKEPISLMKLVLSNKNLGKLAIEKAELPVDTNPEPNKCTEAMKERKEKVALIKQRLVKDFQNRRKQFGKVKTESVEQAPPEESQKEGAKEEAKEEEINDDDDNDEELNKASEKDEMVCSLCLTNQDDILGYPCLSLPTTLPLIIDQKCHSNYASLIKNDTFSLNICQHPIHFKCYKELQNEGVKKMSVADILAAKTPVFQCTIDRGNRNCFLPLFQKVPDDQNAFKIKPSNQMNEAINDFIKQAFYHRAETDITAPIISFCSAILKLEVRHRKRPDCLDFRNVQILLRNFFLALYHGLHEKVKNVGIDRKIKDPLTKLVYKIIQSENPIKDFCYCIQIASSDLDGVFLYEFLRRCAIIEDFALKNIVSSRNFIDWDEVLSFNNLLLRFHVAVEYDADSIELPLFECVELPEKFIGLCMPPFNFDLPDQTVVRAVDLMTGNVVTIPSKQNNQSTIDEYCKKAYNGGLAMFLILSGENASNVLFYASKIKKEWYIDSFYTDQFGDTDPGFQRGVITTLSRDRLENSLDSFLSGDVVL